MGTYRRRALGALVAVAVAAVVPIGATHTAVAAETLRCNSSVTMFGSMADGSFRKYQHDEPENGGRMRPGFAGIGGGWDLLWFAGVNGHVYQVLSNGNLHRFRWNDQTQTWDRFGPGGELWSEKIGEGWDSTLTQNKVTVDNNGDFYKLASNGDITWERYADGKWEKRILETGAANRYDLIVAAGDGVFYVRDPHQNSGQLFRYVYDADSQRWMEQKRWVNDGHGANALKQMFSAGADVLYGSETNHGNPEDGYVWWYRFDKETGYLKPRVLVDTGVPAGMRWAATTNSCEILGATQPQAPIVPARYDAPNTLLQGTDRKVTHFYVNVQGGLTAAKQVYVDNTVLLNYQTFDGHHKHTGQPGAVRRQDGRFEVVTNSSEDGEYRGNLQVDPNGTWQKTAPRYGGLILSDPVIVNDANNVASMFAVDGGGALWRRTGARANDGFLPWVKLGGSSFTSDFTVVRRGADFLVVGQGKENNLIVAKVTDTLGPEQIVGGGIVGRPAAVVHQNGDLQVVYKTTLGFLQTKRGQGDSLAGAPIKGLGAPPQSKGSPAAVLRGGGILEVAVRGEDDLVYISGQTAPASDTFRPWTVPPAIGTVESATEPAGLVLEDGIPVFSFRTPQGEIASVFGYTGPPAGQAQARTSASTSSAPAYTGGVAKR
ncbi:hypothetical protein LFM09_14660 [Lentzea alba]|uniref:tachylectin-related carbohydrate-binding protein n=1 Tax=Lentzea alba TaxID=2714351 RepID=UPI0039BFEC55